MEHLPTSHWVVLVFCGHGVLAGSGRGLHWAWLSLVTDSNQHTAFLKGTALPLGAFETPEMGVSPEPSQKLPGPP